MKVCLLQYNKIHNHSLEILESSLNKDFDITVSAFPYESVDLLNSFQIKEFLDSIDANLLIIGDVFWPTGQKLCEECNKRNITTVFLQHGQWIYIQNKKSLKHYPNYTFLFGDDVSSMCKSWPYGKYSEVYSMGSPRYDFANGITHDSNYIYFSPPVIEELIHNKPSGKIRHSFLKCLESISGIDKDFRIILQPHYRESRIDILKQLFPYADFADPELNSLKLISSSSKVIASRNSTVVLDAIAHKKKVFSMDFSEYDKCFFNRGYFGDFLIESENKKELAKNLQLNFENISHYKKKAKKHIYLGKTSERILNMLKKIESLRYNSL